MEGNLTPFLIEKWEQAFYLFDTNKDGVITCEDYVRIADYISRKMDVTAEEAANLRQEWVKWYNFAVTDHSIKLDFKTFVEGEKRLYEKDFYDYVKLNRETSNYIFHSIDSNKDGQISLDELNVFYEAVGVWDKAAVKTVFQQLDKNKDGFLQRQELEDDYVRHFTEADPKRGQAYLISSVIGLIRY